MTNEEIIEKLNDLEDELKSTQYDLDEAKQELVDTKTELEELKVYTENLENAYDKALQELPDVVLKINDDLINIDARFEKAFEKVEIDITCLEDLIDILKESTDDRFDHVSDRFDIIYNKHLRD
tara:strand:+ start:720 stop:1091 length:372 start_codon:yes stop_codon:yes gene_type:complete